MGKITVKINDDLEKELGKQMSRNGRPKKGDVVIWQRINSPSKGHVGIVTKAYISSPTKFDAIEGNIKRLYNQVIALREIAKA